MIVGDLTRRFGALVRQLRLEKGMSKEPLAELCGLHRNYNGAIERAERTPSIVTADKLAKAFGVRTVLETRTVMPLSRR